jgi:hypothetical protein
VNSRPDGLTGVTLLPISGEGNQCWYRAVGQARGLSPAEISEVLRDTVESIVDIPTLCRYGLLDDPLATSESAEVAKTAYLTSADFIAHANGGTVEMYLLSHAAGGDLSFLVIDPTTVRFREPVRRYCCLENHLDVRAPTTRKEIALHFCCYSGRSNQPNHYDLFRYELEDNSSSYIWTSGVLPENPAERTEREQMLLHTASKSVAQRRAQYESNLLDENLALQEVLLHDGTLKTPPCTKSARKEKHPRSSLRPAAKAAAAKPPALKLGIAKRRLQFAESSSRSPANDPSPRPPMAIQVQTRTWREIPRACRKQFLATVSPYFEEYLKWSTAGDLDNCMRVMERILDLPSQAMRKGPVNVLNQSLSDFQSHFTELTKPGSLDVIQPTGASDSVTASIPLPTIPNSLSLPISESASPSFLSSSVLAAQSVANPENAQVDSEAETEVSKSPAAVAEAKAETASIRRAVATVREGAPRALSRAAHQLLQESSAPINAETVEQLRALHPTATEVMEPIPKNRAAAMVAIDASALFRILKRRVNNGSSPGPSGWTGSHLQLIANCSNADAKEGLAAVIQDLCNGRFEGSLKSRLLSCTLMPIWKAGGASSRGIRPIAIGEVFVKLAAHYSMAMIEDQLPSLFSRIQYGVKRPGGSETAAQLTRALFEQSRRDDPTTIALKTDFQNAFNATSRAQAWRTLLAHSNTEPIWRMFHWAYSSESPLLVFDKGILHTILSSSEGMRQGDPFAAFAFALCVQSLYEKVLKGSPGCKAVSVLDDLTLIGPLAEVVQVYDRIKQLAPEYHLALRTEKCQVFIPPQLDDRSILDSIHSACHTRSLNHRTRIEALGVVFGKDSDVEDHAAATVMQHARFFDLLTHPSMPVQVGYSLLRYCAVPRLSFLSRTIHPRLFAASAARFDSMVRDCLAKMMQIDAGSKGLLAPSLTAQQIDERISLPINMGGLGMRPFTRTSHAAYFSSLATILPDFHVAFPSCADLTATVVHSELSECRAAILPHIDIDATGKTLKSIHETVARLGGKQHPRGPYKPREIKSAQGRARAKSFRVPPRPRDSDSSRANAAAAITDSVRTILRCNLTELWTSAKSCATNATESHSFLRRIRLQHEITRMQELKRYESHFQSSSRYQQSILTALALTRNSSSWLTVLPTEWPYRMSDSSFRLAVRHRLGLLPFDSLAHRRCIAATCSTSTTFATDPDHMHSCALHRRTLCTQRHNNLMQTLMDLARSVGFYASREPNHHRRPAGIGGPGTDKWNDHADILLVKHNRRLYIDVCVTRPTNASNLQKSAIICQPLFSTRSRSSNKHGKYDAIAAENGYEMFPFILETYGGIGQEAHQLLHILASHATEGEEKQFLQHAYRCISVSLQSSNSDLAQAGMHMLHTDEIRKGNVHMAVSLKKSTSATRLRKTASAAGRVREPRKLDQTKAGIEARKARGVLQRQARQARKEAAASHAAASNSMLSSDDSSSSSTSLSDNSQPEENYDPRCNLTPQRPAPAVGDNPRSKFMPLRRSRSLASTLIAPTQRARRPGQPSRPPQARVTSVSAPMATVDLNRISLSHADPDPSSMHPAPRDASPHSARSHASSQIDAAAKSDDDDGEWNRVETTSERNRR